MKFEDLQINNLEAESKLKSEKIERPPELRAAETDDFDLSKEIVQSEIKDAQEIQKVRQEIASVPETEILPTAQEKNTEVVEQKPGWLTSKLDTAKRYLKIATLGTSVFMGANKVEAANINQSADNRIIDNQEQTSNIEDKNEKSIDGGNIAEVVVYGRKQYEAELLKQEGNLKKYLADLEKYKKDSVEWVKAKEAYQDSSKLYEVSKQQLNKFYKLVDFYKDGGRRLTADEVLALNKKIDSQWRKADAFGRVKSGDIEEVPYSDKRPGYASFSSDKPEAGRYWADEKDEKAENFMERIKDDVIKPKFVPIEMTGIDYGEFGKEKYNYRAVYDKPKGGLKNPPIRPEYPKAEKITYDPKYEDLNMRSLWATMVKKNPNEKIGTLHNLDPNFEKGFTLEEAMSFPQEIKDKYNIDYIYNQIKGKQ
ncbi:MAG: hypothetical protein WCW61_00770 [Patescibacteria group bacterium]